MTLPHIATRFDGLIPLVHASEPHEFSPDSNNTTAAPREEDPEISDRIIRLGKIGTPAAVKLAQALSK
jgi:hypothetical protein